MVVDKRHPDYETFSADDKILEIKDEILNNKFSKLNAGTDGPKFSLDLLKCSRLGRVEISENLNRNIHFT
jgi:hypothetical protein